MYVTSCFRQKAKSPFCKKIVLYIVCPLHAYKSERKGSTRVRLSTLVIWVERVSLSVVRWFKLVTVIIFENLCTSRGARNQCLQAALAHTSQVRTLNVGQGNERKLYIIPHTHTPFFCLGLFLEYASLGAGSSRGKNRWQEYADMPHLVDQIQSCALTVSNQFHDRIRCMISYPFLSFHSRNKKRRKTLLRT